MSHLVKKEQHQCNFPDCRCILHPERLDCWSKALHKCNHPKEPEYTSPRPDGWEIDKLIDEKVTQAFYFLDSPDAMSEAFGDGTIHKKVSEIVKQFVLSTRQEDARKFREMIGEDEETPSNVEHPNYQDYVDEVEQRNELRSELRTALSTWEEKNV